MVDTDPSRRYDVAMTTNTTATIPTYQNLADDLVAAGVPSNLADVIVENLYSACWDLAENTRDLQQMVARVERESLRALESLDQDQHINYRGVYQSSAVDADRLAAIRECRVAAVMVAMKPLRTMLPDSVYTFDLVRQMAAR